MILKKISEKEYNSFVTKNEYHSFYQSIEWMKIKEKEGKKCELLGLFDNDKLIGASLVIYLRALRNNYIAYASRGFIYDYSNIKDFTDALKEYFSNKNIIMVKIDPPIILATYDKDLNKTYYEDSEKIINSLKENGFVHFGYNMADEAYQFRFVHRIDLLKSFDKQKELMNKSTNKNMDKALFMGVKIKEVDKDNLDDVLKCFEYTEERKHFKGLSKKFYESLKDEYKDNCILYLVYIDKNECINNIKNKMQDIKKEHEKLVIEMSKVNVGYKLMHKQEQLHASYDKLEKELEKYKDIPDNEIIASMVTVTKYDEVVSLSSGMNDKYREFCPKYIMYPEMIKKAIDQKLKYVNFLGVKNIFDKNDVNHGVYEVKRGFGGQTIEYIGEFDLPINKFLYKLYKLKSKIKK